jgi:DUF2075 family protein
MNPELTIFAENKVLEILDNLKTMDDCGRASKVIDAFEKVGSKQTTKDYRDELCDRTFEMYDKIHGKGNVVNTKIQTELDGREVTINLV